MDEALIYIYNIQMKAFGAICQMKSRISFLISCYKISRFKSISVSVSECNDTNSNKLS